MVIDNAKLDSIFGALSDTTRRGMLAQLVQGEINISALAKPYKMSQPAISKHLRVLENAGLIKRSRRGREHLIRINPGSAKTANAWIQYYTELWTQQFDAVEKYLNSTE